MNVPGPGAGASRPPASAGRRRLPSGGAPVPATVRNPGTGQREARRGHLSEVARGSTLNLAGAAGAAVATLGTTVLVTREFSKPEAGAFFAATSVFLIAIAIGGLGTRTGVVYFIARLRSLGEEKRIPVILRAAFLPVAVASVLAALALALFAGPLSHLLLHGQLGSGQASRSVMEQTLRILAIGLPFAALLDGLLGATRGYRDMRVTVLVDNLGRSIGQCVGVLVAIAAGSAALLAPLWALPYIPAAVAAWLWLRRIRRRPRPAAQQADADLPPALALLIALATPVASDTQQPALKSRSGGSRMSRRRLANANPAGFWRFTAPRGLASVAQITLQRIDIVLVAIMRGPAEAAVYTAATRFLVVGQTGSLAISNAAQPRFTEFFAVGDRRSARAIYQGTTAWLVVLTWPLYLLAVVYGPEVLAIFGHSYRAGHLVMVILGLSMLVGTAAGQVDMVLITSGRTSWSLMNLLTTVSINVGLDIYLIPRYGITGAAIGWAVAIGVNNLVPLAQVATVTKLHPFGRGTLIACAVSAVSFLAVPLALRAAFGPGAIPSLAGVLAGALVMGAGLWRFRSALRLWALPGISAVAARLAKTRK